ncbi:MAG: ABC-type transport auxiliary lipoprotein family protein [Rhodospirillales bacterium]
MKVIRWICGIAVCLVLAACSQPPVPKDNYYRLQAGTPAQVYGKPLFAGTVEVQRFTADGVMANRPIAYASTEEPNKLNEYHYHFWTEPPPIMLRDQMIDYMRRAKVAEKIVSPELRILADFVISGKIKRFEHIRGAGQHAAVELELAARNNKNGDLLYLGTYGVKTPVDGGDVAAAVAAIDRSVREIYARFLKNIAERKNAR